MEDGLFKGARGIIIDVTEQRQVEEALRESEGKYRLLFESAGDAIFIHDTDARMLAVNRWPVSGSVIPTQS